MIRLRQKVRAMMTVRTSRVSAAAWLAGSVMLVLMPSAAPARPGAPPFCVARGGARGIPLPQLCQFFDYQQCLQAAADLHGNCVMNIDYHGEVSTSPVPGRARHR
jgi:hypothetical protein